MRSSVRARTCSAPTSSTAAAMRRWGARGRTSTSLPSAARRSGKTRQRATRRRRRTSGGTTTTPTARPRDAMASIESELSALFDRRSEAMRMKDIDRLMSLFAPDIVYFDLVPPLQYAGSAALRERFLHWFEGWDGPSHGDPRLEHMG